MVKALRDIPSQCMIQVEPCHIGAEERIPRTFVGFPTELDWSFGKLLSCLGRTEQVFVQGVKVSPLFDSHRAYFIPSHCAWMWMCEHSACHVKTARHERTAGSRGEAFMPTAAVCVSYSMVTFVFVHCLVISGFILLRVWILHSVLKSRVSPSVFFFVKVFLVLVRVNSFHSLSFGSSILESFLCKRFL